jgi:hypothetical protein
MIGAHFSGGVMSAYSSSLPHCPACSSALTAAIPWGDFHILTCPNHGTFTVTDTAVAMANASQKHKAALAVKVAEGSGAGSAAMIWSGDLESA